MQVSQVKEIIRSVHKDPCFFIKFHNIGRGLVGDSENNKSEAFISRTKILNCWKISGDKLQKVDQENSDILFDAETYIFQWIFELVINGDVNEEILFYYWKGSNAPKGYSPLPSEIEQQSPAVERICQWSEPALFFHMFTSHLAVLRGSQEKFNPTKTRLFMVRGEVPSEIHLYEISCLKENLRSRGVFLLLKPSECTIYYWYGSAVPKEYKKNIRNKIKLKEKNEKWANYKIIEIKEEEDNDSFFKLLVSQTGDYVRLLQNSNNFTPRLFYLNSITGNFLATEIEYPLRSKQQSATFPFLQSHLYTADHPALFLLDNDKEIWLWEGWNTSESNMELFKTELELAKEMANNYAKEKDCNQPIPVRHVLAGFEPLEFTNIFPYWNKKK